MTINKCTGAKWKNQTELLNALTKSRLRVALINSYFDFDDYDSPVKSYIDDSVFTRTTAGFYIHFFNLIIQKRE